MNTVCVAGGKWITVLEVIRSRMLYKGLNSIWEYDISSVLAT